jgi:hypothetical protein
VIVAARGLAEYRLTSTRSTTTLYLTLLRATGDVADWVRLQLLHIVLSRLTTKQTKSTLFSLNTTMCRARSIRRRVKRMVHRRSSMRCCRSSIDARATKLCCARVASARRCRALLSNNIEVSFIVVRVRHFLLSDFQFFFCLGTTFSRPLVNLRTTELYRCSRSDYREQDDISGEGNTFDPKPLSPTTSLALPPSGTNTTTSQSLFCSLIETLSQPVSCVWSRAVWCCRH